MHIDNIKDTILKILKEENHPLAITAIAQKIGINRHAVARHLDVLETIGVIRKIEKGTAKKYFLVQYLHPSSLIDISSDPTIIIDPHFIIQYANNSASRYFGFPHMKMIGKKLENIRHPLLKNKDIQQTLISFTYEHPDSITVQDDKGRWFEVTILGISLLHAPNQIAIICTDITEKKQIEQELLMTQEKYVLAFQASPDGIIMSETLSGEIIEVNPSFCKMFGYSEDEMTGSSTYDLGILTSKDERDFLIHNTRNQDTGEFHFYLKARNKSGEFLDVIHSSSIIRIGDKEYLLSIARDMKKLTNLDDMN